MKEAVELLLESNVFALTFDIGHDYCIGNKDIEFINRNINRLIHMHIHDAISNKNHLPLGKGEIDIELLWNVHTIFCQEEILRKNHEILDWYTSDTLKICALEKNTNSRNYMI